MASWQSYERQWAREAAREKLKRLDDEEHVRNGTVPKKSIHTTGSGQTKKPGSHKASR